MGQVPELKLMMMMIIINFAFILTIGCRYCSSCAAQLLQDCIQQLLARTALFL